MEQNRQNETTLLEDGRVDVILLMEDRSNVENPQEPGDFKVVVGQDENGNLKGIKPSSRNQPRYQTISKNDDALEAFLKGLTNGAKWGYNLVLYQVPATADVQKVISGIEAAIRDPYKQENRDLLAEYELNRWDYVQHVNENELDWAYLENFGVTKEALEKAQELDNLLTFKKTNLVPVKLKVGDTIIPTEARLTLYNDPTSKKLRVGLTPVKMEPELNLPFMGYKFTPEDRKNLLSTGNLGKQVELMKRDGTTFKAYISVDPQTNELIPMRAEKLRIPHYISGVELTEEQHQALVEGKAIEVEGLKNRIGEEYKATLQVNAEKRGIEFSYNGGPQNLAEKYQQEKQRIMAERGMPNYIAGVKLTEPQKEALLAGQALYIKGMKRKDGGEFNSYVLYDKDKKKLGFSRFNPNKIKQSDIVLEAQRQQQRQQLETPTQHQQQDQKPNGLKVR